MNFVANDNDHCAQACIAMLTGCALYQVLETTGTHQLGLLETCDQLEKFGIKPNIHRKLDGNLDYSKHRVTPLSNFNEDSTLLCRIHLVHVLARSLDSASTATCGVSNHLVLIHKSQLFDPSLESAYPLTDGMRKWSEYNFTPFFSVAIEVFFSSQL